jgi:hypothetical protein
MSSRGWAISIALASFASLVVVYEGPLDRPLNPYLFWNLGTGLAFAVAWLSLGPAINKFLRHRRGEPEPVSQVIRHGSEWYLPLQNLVSLEQVVCIIRAPSGREYRVGHSVSGVRLKNELIVSFPADFNPSPKPEIGKWHVKWHLLRLGGAWTRVHDSFTVRKDELWL